MEVFVGGYLLCGFIGFNGIFVGRGGGVEVNE